MSTLVRRLFPAIVGGCVAASVVPASVVAVSPVTAVDGGTVWTGGRAVKGNSDPASGLTASSWAKSADLRTSPRSMEDETTL